MSLTASPLVHTLRGIMRDIRDDAPHRFFPMDRAASSDIRTGYLDGVPVRRLVVTFRAPGCAWVDRGGGCTMCGHHAGTTRGEVPSPGEYLEQFRSETARHDFSEVKVLSLYNSGSMLNPREVPRGTLDLLFREICAFDSVRKVVLETRAEFVCADEVSRLADILGRKRRLSVALGLETSDDRRRELCLNKGCSLEGISRAVGEAKKAGAGVQLYVLLGLPFLTEAESVDDAVKSLECAQNLGADEIHIEPLTIQRHTLVERLHRAGLLRLPSLYSLYETLERVLPAIRPYVSPFMHMPLPDIIPSGCPVCTDALIEGLLGRYNISRDHASLVRPGCPCEADWRARMEERDPRPLEDRIVDALALLSRGDGR